MSFKKLSKEEVDEFIQLLKTPMVKDLVDKPFIIDDDGLLELLRVSSRTLKLHKMEDVKDKS